MKTLNWIVASSLLSVAVCLPARAQSSPALMLVEQQQLDRGLAPLGRRPQQRRHRRCGDERDQRQHVRRDGGILAEIRDTGQLSDENEERLTKATFTSINSITEAVEAINND